MNSFPLPVARTPRARFWIGTALGLAAAAFTLLAGIGLSASYRAAWRDAMEEGRNVALALAHGASRTLAAPDQTLRELVLLLHDATPQAAEEAISASHRRHTAADRPPTLGVLDAAGRVLAVSASLESGSLRALQADTLFRADAIPAASQPTISRPFRAAPDQPWLIALGRGFAGQGGMQAGLVVAIMPIDQLIHPFRAISLGPNGIVSLARADGILIGRAPGPSERTGIDISGTEAFRRVRANPTDQFIAPSPADGTERLYSTQPVPDFPLVLAAIESTAGITARWRADALLVGIAYAGVLVCLALAALLLRREQRGRDAAASALEQSLTEFRLVAEHSSDMVVRVRLDGVREYVSPAAHRLLGRAPEEMMARNVFDEATPTSSALLRAATDRLLRGDSETERVCHQLRHADGHMVPVETVLRLMREGSGRVIGFVAVNRDDSARQAEERVLRAAAMQDGLTGLANRRGFDAALHETWGRCAAAAQPLSLALIDMDGFKALNDRHGHPAGDAALRAVGRTLRSALRREGDMAARLGGDEMALLLPGAESDDALRVAERVRATVARRFGAEDGLTLSASIGVATLHPGLDDDPARLVARADAALYRAKSEGRNRVRLAA